MTEQKGGQDTYNPEETLKTIDKEKFPKLYETTEKLVKSKEAEQSLKIRAEMAEKKAKKAVNEPQETETPTKPVETEDTPKKSEYSLQDIRALSDVHDDDVDEVVDYAKSKGITVAEAKKTPMIQSFLENTKGERKTADATNTGKGKQGSSKVSGSSLLRKAQETGEMPESDADLDKLLEAELKK